MLERETQAIKQFLLLLISAKFLDTECWGHVTSNIYWRAQKPALILTEKQPVTGYGVQCRSHLPA